MLELEKNLSSGLENIDIFCKNVVLNMLYADISNVFIPTTK